MKKPTVKLRHSVLQVVDQDGNAYCILAKCIRVARQNDWSQSRIESFLSEAKSGDYEHLLQIVMKNFDID